LESVSIVEDLAPPPSPSRNPFSIGFRTPANPLSSQLPSPSSSPENLTETLDDLAPDSGPEFDESASSASPDDTPSRGSSRGSDAKGAKVELLSEEDMQKLARGGVAVAGEKAHELLATTEGQRDVGLYLTDEKDQANIGDPLGSIASRHQGIGKEVNPDVKDLLSALVGLFAYGTKQINKRSEARGRDAGAAGPQPMPEAVDL
jgi:hypothetical protein